MSALSALHGRKRGDATSAQAPSPLRPVAYLPVVVLASTVVIALPVALTRAVMPSRGAVAIVGSIAVTVVLSGLLAHGAAATWKRWPYSRDLVFAELMPWGWLRRCWAEWRLHRTRTLYESVKEASPGVSMELLERLSRVLEARDAYTYGHSRRVARHAVRVARIMGLSPGEVAKVRAAAVVHDVGKLYTPRAVLNNPGRLSSEEFEIVKRHPADGADMLGPAGDRDITAMVRHHHERLDGSGYPDGLVGERIPLGARIIAVADTFDAVTSHRPYRRAGTHKRGLDILSHEAGSKLDAAAVAAFRQSYSASRPAAWLAFAVVVPQRLLALLQASSPIGANAGLATQIVPALGAAGILAAGHGVPHRPVQAHPKRVSAASAPHRRLTSAAYAQGSAAPGHAGQGRPASRRGRVPAALGPSGTGHRTQRKPSFVAPSASRPGADRSGQPAPGGGGSPGTPPPTPIAPSPETPPLPPASTPSPPPTVVRVPEVPNVEVPGVELPTSSLPDVKGKI